MADNVEDESYIVCQIEHEKTEDGRTAVVLHTFKNDLEDSIQESTQAILKLFRSGINPKSLRIHRNTKTLFSTSWNIKKAE